MKRYCPICQEEVADGLYGKYAPFCSDRCRLIDLNGWLTEEYTVPEEDDPDIIDEG